ncbi:MAG: ATP-binding protein [Patescibacteria group bacterium]
MLSIFSYYSLSLFLGGIVALFSGIFVFLNNSKKMESIVWLLLTISTAIWSFGYYIMIITPDKHVAWISDVILHIGASFIPFFYLFFIIAITNVFGQYKKLIYCLSPIAIFFVLVTPSSLFVTDVYQKGPFSYAPNAGILYTPFTAYFFIVVIIALAILLIQIKKSERKEALRLKFIFGSSIFGFIGGSSVFFLTFNVFVPPFPVILFAFYPMIIAYAVLRYNLFDVRIITAELLTATIWITLLFRTVLSNNGTDQVISGIILAITVLFGIWLVRNVYHEITQREKIEKLAKDLESANVRLTELDRQKSEFVSFATHQLRAPLTAMKGYASMILDGDMGKLADEAKLGVSRIYDSAQTLTNIVDDYLNITRIELGTMKYAFETINWRTLIDDILAELKPNIEKSKLAFSFNVQEENMDYRITADRDKFKQVIANLIDNSMKYTPKGTVALSLSFDRARRKYVFMIKDTGIGIAPEVLPHLFAKWSRAGNANKTNIKGTGLGLFVAKEIITAHHGEVRAESPGEGKGSTFIVEMEPFGKM